MFTGSPSDQMHVAIVDAATFTVQKRIPMIASAAVPGYVDIDPEGGRVYVTLDDQSKVQLGHHTLR